MATISDVPYDNFAQNPVDLAESLCEDRDWLFDRPLDEELIAEVSGGWCTYRIWCNWQPDMEVMMFSCAMENKLPEKSLPVLYPLLAAVNEKLWLGHFDVCSEEHILTFRHTLLLRGGKGASLEQIEDLIDIAITECDRFYPAFQTVVWGGNTAKDALQIALMDTVGEA